MARARTWRRWVVLAVLLIIMSGIFNVLVGLAGIIGPDDAYVDTDVGLVVFDVQAWGWTHIVLGILLILVGAGLNVGERWARVAAVALVTLNLLTQFVQLPAQPWWSAIIIAIDVVVLWALVAHGDGRTRR